MKQIVLIILVSLMISSCSPTPEQLAGPVQSTLAAMSTATPYPTYTPGATYTPYPTATPQPTVVVTQIVVQTPTPDISSSKCKPMTKMDYTDNSRVAIMLQAYVALLPGVRQVSYVIPEKLYNNTLSQIYYVSYIDDADGKVYSKRYIAYIREFGWSNGVFSIDGQCWVDGPQ
jgi:hypothetical protein